MRFQLKSQNLTSSGQAGYEFEGIEYQRHRAPGSHAQSGFRSASSLARAVRVRSGASRSQNGINVTRAESRTVLARAKGDGGQGEVAVPYLQLITMHSAVRV